MEKLEGGKDALSVNAISKAKTAIEVRIALVSKRMKLIKIADKSQYSRMTVRDYLSEELGSDSDDEKGLSRSEKRAEKKVKEAKKKRSQGPYHRFQPYPYSNLRLFLMYSRIRGITLTVVRQVHIKLLWFEFLRQKVFVLCPLGFLSFDS